MDNGKCNGNSTPKLVKKFNIQGDFSHLDRTAKF